MNFSNIQNKTIAKNTLALNIRLIITLLIALYTSRLVLNVLGIESYGLYNLVGGFVSLLTIITSSITGSITRFITYSLGVGDLEKLNKTFCSIVNVLILLSIITLIIAFIIGPWFIASYLNIPSDRIPAAITVYACSVIIFILNMMCIPYVSLVTAHEHMNFYAIMSVLDAVLKLGVIVLLNFYGTNKLCLYAFLLVLSTLVIQIGYRYYCRSHFLESRYRFIIDKKCFKEIMSFSLWIGLGSAAGILKDQGGAILLNIFFGLILNASMGIANQVKGVIAQFGNSIGLAISPQITKSYAENNNDRAISLTFYLVKCQSLFMMLVAIPLLVETQFILEMWLGIIPDFAIEIVQILICATFFNVLSMGYAPLFLAIGKIRNFEIISSGITICYIPICYFLLSRYHNPLICVIVSFFMEFIMCFVNYACLKVQVLFPFKRFVKELLLKVIIIALSSFLIVKYLQIIVALTPLVRLIFVVLASTTVVSLGSYFLLLSKKERSSLLSFVLMRAQLFLKTNKR